MKKYKNIFFFKNGEKAVQVSLTTIICVILILIAGIVVLGAIFTYSVNSSTSNKMVTGISKLVPFPAAVISWNHTISVKDIDNNLNSILQFYATQNFSNEGLRIDFSTAVGQKRLEIKRREILDKMVEDQIIQILASERGIKISNDDVDKAVTAKLNEYGTENDVKADLAKSYGWNIDDFKNRVVLPGMYTDALSQSVLEEKQDLLAQAKTKIAAAQNELNGGADFAQVAQKYSEGSTANNGGELGWVSQDQLVAELGNAIFGNTQIQKNSIIESSLGFHIVDVENRKKENGQDVVQLRQIFVGKFSFSDWLMQQKEKMNVWIPLSEFKWNKSTGSVEFADPVMQKFETDERAKAQGDASLMF